MAVKTFKPITPSLRYKSVVDFSVLTPQKERKKIKGIKRLMSSLKRNGGRNGFGHITTRHQGGGHKKKYRQIDFRRDKLNISATVAAIAYDPNRSAFIALLNYLDGEKRFILAPVDLKVGDKVIASDEADIKPGNSLTLSAIPLGTMIHNIELEPGRGGTIARSAGSAVQLMAKEGEYCQVKMPSGEMRKVHRRCRATIGQVSNTDHENIKIGKAGRKRWLGVRPSVRGVAMNPVDHPMGGGEGKSSGGHPRSPWGQKAKGLKTRKIKRTNVFIVKRRTK